MKSSCVSMINSILGPSSTVAFLVFEQFEKFLIDEWRFIIISLYVFNPFFWPISNSCNIVK